MSKASSSTICSMTGYSSVEGSVGGVRVRLEMKALNHRFLDLKVRLPRELSSLELPLRASLQTKFARGAVEFKAERLVEAEGTPPPVQANLGLAAHYFETLITLQRTLGLTDPIKTMDIATLPDVISRSSQEFPGEQAWTEFEPLVQKAADSLLEMRRHEGAALAKILNGAIDELEGKIKVLRQKRRECEAAYRSKIAERIGAIFENYPLPESLKDSTAAQSFLETRIAQELALVLDRTDIEEELTRFQGHLGHFRKVMNEGGQVGRKLDFILQELHREINTLGNKAQDFSMSEEVVQVKVRLEQIREQVMNLE